MLKDEVRQLGFRQRIEDRQCPLHHGRPIDLRMIDSAPASFTMIFTDDASALDCKLFEADVEGASERLDKKVAPALLGIERRASRTSRMVL